MATVKSIPPALVAGFFNTKNLAGQESKHLYRLDSP